MGAPMTLALAILGGLLALVVVYDAPQPKHAILRNFPVVRRLPLPLRRDRARAAASIVTDNDEERPFSRDERSWVYASAKKENNYFGFGTDNDLENAASTSS